MQLTRMDKQSIAVLDDNGSELGRLVKPSIWSSRRELILAGEGLYHLQPKGRLSRHQLVVMRTPEGLDIPLLELRYTWRGRVEMARPGAKEATHVLRRAGFWKPRFVLSDAQGAALVTFRVYQKVFGPNEFVVEEWGAERPAARELLLAVHASSVMLERAAAGAAAS